MPSVMDLVSPLAPLGPRGRPRRRTKILVPKPEEVAQRPAEEPGEVPRPPGDHLVLYAARRSNSVGSYTAMESPRSTMVVHTIFLELAHDTILVRPKVKPEVWHGRLYLIIWWHPLRITGSGRALPVLRPENWHTALVKAEFPWGAEQRLPRVLRRAAGVCRGFLWGRGFATSRIDGNGLVHVPLGESPINDRSWTFKVGDDQLRWAMGWMQHYAQMELVAAGFWVEFDGCTEHLHISWNN